MEPLGVCKTCKSPITVRSINSRGQSEASKDSLLYTAMPYDSSERSDIVENISLLDELIEDLSRRRSNLKTRLNSLTPMVSRLPQEVLSEVFIAVCRAGEHNVTGTSTSTNEHHSSMAPLFLGSICNAWRRVAWSTPRIWAHCFLRMSPRKYTTQLSLLREWLARARGCSLSIKISARHRDQQKWALNPPADLLRLVASYSTQWLSLDILMADRFSGYLSEAQGQTPILRTLRVRRIHENIMGSIAVFDNSPQLTDVSYVSAASSPTTLIVPWHNITQFHLEKTTVLDAVQVLRKTINLVHCQLASVHNIFDNVNILPFNIPTLEYLEINGGAITLLDAATFPSLRSLVCTTWGSSFTSVADLLNRSQCPLETLKITGRNHVEEEILTCLVQTPSLVTLEVRDNGPRPLIGPQLISHLLQNLSIADSEPPVVPKLKSLSYVGTADITEELLRNILTARGNFMEGSNESIMPLDSVVIAVTEAHPITLSEDMQKQINRLLEKGMKILLIVNGTAL